MSRTSIYVLLAVLICRSSCLSLPDYDEDSIENSSENVDVAAINNSHCNITDQVCVRATHCLDHLIEDDAEFLPNPRDGQRSCIAPGHPDEAAVCCLNPGAPQPVIKPHPVSSESGEHSEPLLAAVHRTTTVGVCPDQKVCVSRRQCGRDGNVVTDGSGLIDVRIDLKECIVDKISQENGVCCNPPGYVEEPTCPAENICFSHRQCGKDGKIITDGSGIFDIRNNLKKCIVDKISKETGVCCTPPGNVDQTTTTTMKPKHNQCGIRQNNTNPEIIGTRILSNTADNEAEFGEFPWQAIIFSSNYTFICGASLIGDRWLLTAAHWVNGIKPEDLKVRLGEWQVNSFDEPLPYVDLEVSSIYIHPKFNIRNLHNDIAIIELKEVVAYQYHINPICLPSNGQTFLHQRCISTGWGKNAINGQYQTIMKKVELPMVDHNTCQNQFRSTRLGRWFTLDKSFVCAGGEENEDACKGDGGGPLACQDPETGHYMLTGITAWGIGCGDRDVPGAFVNVQEFVPWIHLTFNNYRAFHRIRNLFYRKHYIPK